MEGNRAIALYWGAAAACACLLAPLAPQLAAGLPDCLFRSVTGLPCPTCGATRAALALSRLEVGAAIAFNPLAVLGASMFVLGGLAAGISALAGRPLPLPRLPLAALRALAILAVGADWVWLLLSAR